MPNKLKDKLIKDEPGQKKEEKCEEEKMHFVIFFFSKMFSNQGIIKPWDFVVKD